jgi:hypothetical protein
MIPVRHFKVGDIVRWNDEELVRKLRVSDDHSMREIADMQMTITRIDKAHLSLHIAEHKGSFSGHYWEIVRRPSEEHFEKGLFEV